ncbi:MAG: saccharopine dehydrogenase C-terminal domain-containing protein [Thermodesulfobacteriota bacterium]
MKTLVLGAGLQGRAVIHDLARSPLISRITAVDLNVAGAREFIAQRNLTQVRLIEADALDPQVLAGLIQESEADVVVCMLPAHFSRRIALGCLEAGRSFVNTSYGHWVADLDAEARARGVIILPEMGFDPGIDLMVGRLAVSELDEVEGMFSYGAGMPEAAAANNALKYKITWTFDGVLQAYKRPAVLLKEGRRVDVPGLEIFKDENVHLIDVPGVGMLEAYPNGDAVKFMEIFGLGPSLKEMGRFAARWPGHSAFWRVMAEMGFLSEEPMTLEKGVQLNPHQFLVRHLTPRLQFADDERDLAVLRVQTWGRKNGRGLKVTYDLVDRRDLTTGLFAMNRTVGYTASIGAQLILEGAVTKTGVLSPVRDVPIPKILAELEQRGIVITRRVEKL